MMKALRTTLLALLLIAAVPAFAQQPPAPPPAGAPAASTEWSSLSPDQQKLLERYRDNWNTLPSER